MSTTVRSRATAGGIVSAVALGFTLILNPSAFAATSHPHPQPNPVGSQQNTGTTGNTAQMQANGGYSRSSEAHKKLCANMLNHLKDTQNELNAQHDRGNQDDINSARTDVSDAYDQGFKAGCWGDIG